MSDVREELRQLVKTAAALHLSVRLMRVDRMARKPWVGPVDAAAWFAATIGELPATLQRA